MCGEYAKDPRMRANIGIRRRLAPLLENDRNQIELFTALLLVAAGLAGPLLRRRDRHGRQHLARRPRRRPHADAVDPRPQRRVLHVRPGPAVSARRSWTPSTATRSPTSRRSLKNSTSLLHWTRRMIEVRKQNPAFGLGHRSPTSAAATRRCSRSSASGGDDRRAVRQQPVPVRRSRSSSTCAPTRGASPSRCSAESHFPRIGELPYLLTLAGHGFYWFRLPRSDG